ncbi:hypothetical protein NQ318_000211 [Aromia moschata]|uniref:Uncharacterized protein n=1 Tax=Aromia moschata TaxID=1265417 RepID=A0AAV8YJN3_9CUCU|nr:hypothetical protein NQ318_000211 [Aromia moschata]
MPRSFPGTCNQRIAYFLIYYDAYGSELKFVTLLIRSTAFGISLTVSCESIAQQIKDTLDIGYGVLIDLTEYLEGKEHEALRNALVVFMEHIHSSNFQFSAAGQFPRQPQHSVRGIRVDSYVPLDHTNKVVNTYYLTPAGKQWAHSGTLSH